MIEASVPDTAAVLAPERVPTVPDTEIAVRRALREPIGGLPLAEIARGRQAAAIVVSDLTRPVPNAVLLPPLLETIHAAGIPPERTTIIIGTGLHRVSREGEREQILGADITRRYRVVDHDARDRASHVFLAELPPRGPAPGAAVWVNRAYMEAGLRILTGFVEPHLFAGYSGGGKAMLPGICGAESIMANHDARMIGHPKSTWCTTEGNPIFEEMRAIALKSDPSFILNVTLDERKRVTGVFAGNLVAAHEAAMTQAARQHVRPIARPFDIVVATNMGYPADISLYQSVKGMSVAAQACATGGTILLVAECREGVGGPEFTSLMQSEASPGALLSRLTSTSHATVHDQWQAQVQSMVQARCDVWLHSSLSRDDTEAAHLRWAPDVDRTLAALIDRARAALRREPSVCVLPYGQLTVPRLRRAR
jgi:nickel-dependent lactate racemase